MTQHADFSLKDQMPYVGNHIQEFLFLHLLEADEQHSSGNQVTESGL